MNEAFGFSVASSSTAQNTGSCTAAFGSITLPNNMAETLKERVASGAYASQSEVVRDGLRALFAREEALKNWLRTEVVASIDAIQGYPKPKLIFDLG